MLTNFFPDFDYLNIGSNGFAQLGDPDYRKKNRIEMQVLLSYLEEKNPVPEEFSSYAMYSVKSFPHDFGTYHELVLNYNRSMIDKWEEAEEGPEYTKFVHFWDWFSEVEDIDLESEELTEKIKTEYFKTVDLQKAEHLTVKKAV